MKRFWIMLKWRMGIKGDYCRCGFHEAAHYDHDLEFDMEFYPCPNFRKG